ncbi:MAG TPA: S41 family peptidase [Verrucomicrobiae bacterium]
MRLRNLGTFLFASIFLFSLLRTHARDLVALETFDQVWRTLNENHFDTNFNGHNWNEVRDNYRPRAAAARNGDALREVVQEMLDLLNVSHLAIVPGEFTSDLELDNSDSNDDTSSRKPAENDNNESENSETEPASRASQSLEEADEGDRGTVGMDFRYIGKDLVVTRVEPNLPAAKAGVMPGWIIKRIGQTETAKLKQKLPKKLDDRRRAFLAWRAAAAKLSGDPGSKVAVDFIDSRNRSKKLTLTRATAQGEPIKFGTLPVLYAHLEEESVQSQRGKSVGVIRFNIWMLPTAIAFNKAIDEHRDKSGMIIDLRGNVGGMVGMIIGTAGHFVTKPTTLGTLIARDNTLKLPANPRFVDTSGKRVQPFSGPVAILVDEITASASEVFAGGLQENGRVRVFGRTTAGQALPAVYSQLPNGDALYHPVADFIAANGTRFEGRGVVPDERVESDRAALLAGRDLVLERALHWIDR